MSRDHDAHGPERPAVWAVAEAVVDAVGEDRRRRRRSALLLQLLVAIGAVVVVMMLRGGGSSVAYPALDLDTAGPSTDSAVVSSSSASVDSNELPVIVAEASVVVEPVDLAEGPLPDRPGVDQVAIVPDLSGLTGDAAVDRLRALGLIANCDARRCDLGVVATTPGAGSRVRVGSVVILGH